MFECLMESCDVNDILLVLQIWNQLSNSIGLALLTHEWEIVVQVMQIIRIRHISLQEVALRSFLSQLTDVVLNSSGFSTHLNLPVGRF